MYTLHYSAQLTDGSRESDVAMSGLGLQSLKDVGAAMASDPTAYNAASVNTWIVNESDDVVWSS